MYKCECVYRRIREYKTQFRDHKLVVSKQYKKLMKLVGNALKEGKQVEFEHKIVFDPKLYRKRKYKMYSDWYDKVTVTIK